MGSKKRSKGDWGGKKKRRGGEGYATLGSSDLLGIQLTKKGMEDTGPARGGQEAPPGLARKKRSGRRAVGVCDPRRCVWF